MSDADDPWATAPPTQFASHGIQCATQINPFYLKKLNLRRIYVVHPMQNVNFFLNLVSKNESNSYLCCTSDKMSNPFSVKNRTLKLQIWTDDEWGCVLLPERVWLCVECFSKTSRVMLTKSESTMKGDESWNRDEWMRRSLKGDEWWTSTSIFPWIRKPENQRTSWLKNRRTSFSNLPTASAVAFVPTPSTFFASTKSSKSSSPPIRKPRKVRIGLKERERKGFYSEARVYFSGGR